jgi:hypothetical protein
MKVTALQGHPADSRNAEVTVNFEDSCQLWNRMQEVRANLAGDLLSPYDSAREDPPKKLSFAKRISPRRQEVAGPLTGAAL